MAVDWSHRGDYIVAKHQVTAIQADEALTDPNAVTFIPDYASESGKSIRTVGYSATARDILTVITVEDDGTTYGVNAWKANTKDRRYYEGSE